MDNTSVDHHPVADLPLVVCVDDDSTILQALRDGLRERLTGRAQLELCGSAAEVREVLQDALEDGLDLAVILTDEIMPDVRGHQLLEEVLKIFPDVRAIMLTGQAGAEDIGAAVNTGLLHAFISKPWNRQALELTVVRELESWYEHRQLENAYRMRDFLLAGDPSGVVLLNAMGLPSVWNSAAEIAYPSLTESPPTLRIVDVDLQSMKAASETSLNHQTTCLTSDSGQGFLQHRMFGPGPEGTWAYRVSDVSESVRTSQALERSLGEFSEQQRLETLGLMMSSLAHEFNNVLMVLMSSAECFEDNLPADSDLLEEAEVIQQSVLHAQGLVRQVLNYGRRNGAGAGRFEIGSVLDSTVRMLMRLPGARNRVKVSPVSHPLEVEMSQVHFEQIVVNLVKNALECGPKVRVRVEVSTTPTLRLLVRDDGPGIPAAAVSRLFEPFFTTKGTGRGTGLGLMTCRRLAEQQGAKLDCVETGPDGTVFALTLPASQPPDFEDSALDDAPIGSEHLLLKDRIVLLIEDEVATRQHLIRRLKAFGASHVVGVGRLRELERWLTTSGRVEPALVISDMLLPDGSWLEICDRLESRLSPCPILFISGHASASMVDGHCVGWPREFLAKPFGRADLRASLRALLHQ